MPSTLPKPECDILCLRRGSILLWRRPRPGVTG
nr:MAG TPA: hypothetical protein [Caudoviricetes sp.]